MPSKFNSLGQLSKTTLVALGLGVIALPMASVFATPVDPTQAPVAEEAAALTAEQVEASRVVFNQYSCGACHVLGDAGGSGHIGPSLDGNTNIDRDYIINIVNNGQGPMPGFGGMVSEEEIDQLASYIMEAKK